MKFHLTFESSWSRNVSEIVVCKISAILFRPQCCTSDGVSRTDGHDFRMIVTTSVKDATKAVTVAARVTWFQNQLSISLDHRMTNLSWLCLAGINWGSYEGRVGHLKSICLLEIQWSVTPIKPLRAISWPLTPEISVIRGRLDPVTVKHTSLRKYQEENCPWSTVWLRPWRVLWCETRTHNFNIGFRQDLPVQVPRGL